ncbi:zinc finger protein 580 isoform X2 [Pseudorca crassidens]|uniref:zinc finger protein 580 isoform X2 n=1 Tax=Pseudorca crassidens TaxID=82174 RepID=UPI00352E0137
MTEIQASGTEGTWNPSFEGLCFRPEGFLVNPIPLLAGRSATAPLRAPGRFTVFASCIPGSDSREASPHNSRTAKAMPGGVQEHEDGEVRRADTRNHCSRVFVSRRGGFLGPRLAETEVGVGAVSGLSESTTPRGGPPGAAPRAASHRARTRETSAPRAGAGRMPGSRRSTFWTTWLEGISWTMERLQGLHRISCFCCLPSPAAAAAPLWFPPRHDLLVDTRSIRY